MSDDPKIEMVVPIDPNGKYVFQLPEYATQEDLESLKSSLDKWMHSEHPFMVISNIRLVRVDKEEN